MTEDVADIAHMAPPSHAIVRDGTASIG